MLLIIQIALGIVLGLIFFALLPYIVVAGFWVIAAVLVAVVVAAIIFTDAGHVVAVVAMVLAGVAWMVRAQNQAPEEGASPSMVKPMVIGSYCARCNKIFQSPQCPTCEPKESERTSESAYWG